MPRVSIIIPTWNQAALLAAALESLRRQTFTDFTTIVVDNGSTDDTLGRLAREFPEVRVIALGRNEGFAVATNTGLKAADSPILVCLNNDVACEPGWLAALVAALDRRPEAGSVASRMLDAARPGIIDSAGDAMGLSAWNIGRGEPDGARFNEGREILSACAGAAAYRRELFEQVGWFDERYFAWFEDVDLGIRAQLAGFRCWYEPAAVVKHHGSASAAGMSEHKVFLSIRNGMVLFFKTMPLRRLLPWGPLVLLWPWFDPLVFGRPLRVTVKAWFAFWPMLPWVLRARRDVYRRRRVPVGQVTRLMASPWHDVRRVAAVLLRKAGLGGRPLEAA